MSDSANINLAVAQQKVQQGRQFKSLGLFILQGLWIFTHFLSNTQLAFTSTDPSFTRPSRLLAAIKSEADGFIVLDLRSEWVQLPSGLFWKRSNCPRFFFYLALFCLIHLLQGSRPMLEPDRDTSLHEKPQIEFLYRHMELILRVSILDCSSYTWRKHLSLTDRC